MRLNPVFRMAKAKSPPPRAVKRALPLRLLAWLFRWGFRILVLFLLVFAALRWVNPPISAMQAATWIKQGRVERQWIDLNALPAHVPAAFVAAEDAKFCAHWGFDVEAIRYVIERGGGRGASTITQQTVKNMFLWSGRSWVRKGLEAALAPLAEVLWGKQRILEIYLNIAQTDTTGFGVETGARAYFGKSATKLSASEAARLASVLPSPATRSAANPNANQKRRLKTIQGGAAAILADGRADCFLPKPDRN